MNHVPAPMLRWLRRALIVYNLHFLVGYGLVAFVLGKGAGGAYAFIPTVATLVAVQMGYEIFASKSLFERSPWLCTLISLACAFFATFIVVEPTGVYSSPYFIAVIILTFIGQALGAFIASGVFFILLVGYSLGLAGFFTTPTNLELGALILVATAAAGIGGFFFWKRYYETPTKLASNEPMLTSMLKQEQLKSNVIIDSIDDGVVLIDERKIIRLFNPAAQKIAGWPGDEVIGLDYKTVLKLLDDDGKPYTDLQDPFNQVFDKSLAVHDNSAALSTRDNKQVAITITASPLLDAHNKVTGVIGVFRDVSEQRKQERRSADFVSTASHEMRTPVAAIEGYLALALNDRVSKIDSKARGYLEKAHESTQHLGRLFQDLLTSTKAEDGRLSNHPTAIEMSAFVEKLVEDLRFSAEKKGLQMQYIMGSPESGGVSASNNVAGSSRVIKPDYYVHVDAERLREVVTNLFDNAVKYTEAGSISIGLTGNKDVVQLSVRDTGPGIPANDVPHLFQKFYRVDSSATRTIGGTGLGLFICRKIIELYNGRIWVESTVGKGSTFYINLPRLTNDKAREIQNNEAATVTTVTPLSTGGAS